MPLHADDVCPPALPYVPAGHRVQGDPAVLNWPAVHWLHELAPAELDLPAAHNVQFPAPLELYCPAAHKAAVELVEPAGQ